MTEYVQEMLKEAREELVRADAKASLILASSGVAIGALMAGLLAGSWGPSDLDNRIEWLWWLGASAAGYGLYRLAESVFPRTDRKGEAPAVLAYYGDINKETGDLATLKQKLADSSAHAQDRYVDQLRQVSRIVGAKYAGIKMGLLMLGVAAVLCALAVLIGG